MPVPCRIVDADASEIEISLAENLIRAAMHPADQVEAFAALADAGAAVSAIAARFGVAERTVEQRLRLGNAAPELLQAYREDVMDLECLKAFAITTDRVRQTCGNPRGVDATLVENRVIPLLSRSVLEELDLPELVRRAAEDSALRRERLAATVADGRQRIARLIDAIEQGAQSQAAHRRILDIEHDTAAIQLELDSLPTVTASAPEDLAERLRERLASLHRAIADAAPEETARKSALLIARNLDCVPRATLALLNCPSAAPPAGKEANPVRVRIAQVRAEISRTKRR